jgi:multiple sugar transport system ATP-binding protein
MSNLQLRSLCKSYTSEAHVLRDVTLDVAEGEFCVFIGPSGCGKSTLLRTIAGLEEISTGDLLINAVRMNDVPPAKRGVAMVFQSYALFPHLSVFDNLAFGMQLGKVAPSIVRQKVLEVARVLELEALLDRKPKALSGGQRQRVAIGRAIVREPGVFLFDEPLSNLDAALRVQTRLEIARIHRSYGKASTVYVTHDQVEAMTLADKILLLNAGEAVGREGSVAQYGTPLELYHHPRNLFVAGFIGSPKMNFLPGQVVEGTSNMARVRLRTGEEVTASVDARSLLPGQAVTVGVRPEHARPGDDGQHLIRTVRWQERLGDTTCLYMEGEGEQASLVVRAPGKMVAHAGQRVAVNLPADDMHVFDDQGRAMPRAVTLQDECLPSAA